jgi:hypothetical protein
VTLPQLHEIRAIPLWSGYALIALAVAITLLGKHGARLANATLLGTGAFCAAFYGLRGVGHEWVPGISAILLGGGFAVLGLAHLAAGTGAVFAVIFAPLGWLSARQFHLEWEVPVACAAVAGFCFGAINRKWLALILPPILSAAMLVAGVERLWKPQFGEVVKLSAAGVLALLLLIVSVERNHRARLRKEARGKRDSDEKLKSKLTAQQAAFRRAHGDTSRAP